MTETPGGIAIKRHVDEILASPSFVRSKRLGAFLSWVVDRALAGEQASITERNIAILVYGRAKDFDPKIAATVRAEAMRLRHKLREYYETAPAGGPRIDIPKGAYAPVFSGFATDREVVQAEEQEAKPPFSTYWLAAAVACMAFVLVPGAKWIVTLGPSDPSNAARLVAQADRLRLVGDDLSALALIDQAATIQPEAADVHLTRAAVLRLLGHMNQARAELARAQELGVQEGALQAYAGMLARAINTDPRGATQRLRAMLKKQPDSPDLLAQLAANQLGTADSSDALATIRAARRLPDAARNPELDRLEALAFGEQGKNAAAIAIAVRGEQKAAASKATYSLGRLMVLEGGLRLNNGESDLAILTLHRARDFCLAVGDEICVAQTYRIEGNRLVYVGQFQQALNLYRKGLALTRECGNWHETDRILEGMDAALDGHPPYLKVSNVIEQQLPLLPKLQN